jgi:GLPGLI family protein
MVIALLGTISSLQAQKRLSEATITYDIEIESSGENPQAADLLDGAVNMVYLKGNSSRSEMISTLGSQSTIVDGKTGKVTILKEYGDKKYMINLTAQNWKNSNEKYEDVEFRFEEEYKTIASYNCQKAIGTMKDGTIFTVYFTRDLVPVNRDFQYLNKSLPGLAMQYEATVGTRKVIYTVSNISFNLVPAAKFDLPKSGYRVMSYEESLGAGK